MDNFDPTDENAKNSALVASLVGRTIVEAVWHGLSGADWPRGEERLDLVLDDGRTIEIDSYGYDINGVEINVTSVELAHRRTD